MNVSRAGALVGGMMVLTTSLIPGGMAAPVASAQQEPARCNWVGTATREPQTVGNEQSILRLRVTQDLSNPEAQHDNEDTVQVNSGYESSFYGRYNIRPGTQLQVSGYIRQGGQCVVDTLNVGTLQPGYEGYVRPPDVCLSPGSGTISVSEKASRPLGCAVSPQLSLETPTEVFQGGRMFYSRGIYVLQIADANVPDAGTWSGVRDAFRDPEPETLGLQPPAEGLIEPRRGFGKAWRESYGGAEGPLGWALEDEQTVRASWQQFDNGIVIVLATGEGFILYHADRAWEQRNR